MAPDRRRPRAGARGAVPGDRRGDAQSPLTAGRGRGRSETKYPSGEYEIVQGRSDPFAGRECHRIAAHRATRQRRRRRRGARNTPRGNSMVDTSVERPAKIPRVPTKCGAPDAARGPLHRDGALRGDGRGTPDALLRGRVKRIDAVRDPRRSASRARGRPARERHGGRKRARGRLPDRGRRRDATSETTRQGRKPPRTSTSTSTSPPTRPPHSSTTRSPRFPTPPRPPPADLAPRPPDGRFNNASASFCLAQPLTPASAFRSRSRRRSSGKPTSARSSLPSSNVSPGHGRADPPRHPRHRAERPTPARRRRRW